MELKTSKINQNWASDIFGMIKEAGSAFNSPDIMLGEVVTPPPNLTIKVGDIVLYKDQLLVADYLLNDYKRAYLMEGIVHLKATADAELTGKTKTTVTPDASIPSTVVGDHGSHAHGTHTHPAHDHDMLNIEITTTKENFTAHGDGKDPVVGDGTASDKYFWFKDTLKPKDLVLVQQLPKTHYFAVMNKLVKMEDVN